MSPVIDDHSLPASLVTQLVGALNQASQAEMSSRGVNSHLGELASAALDAHPEIQDALQAHGFVQGEHARHFYSELTAHMMALGRLDVHSQQF